MTLADRPETTPDVQTPDVPEELPRMGLLEHLEELRKRIVRSLIAFGVAFLGCWFVVEPISGFLVRPVEPLLPEGQKLVFLGVPDVFFFYLKVAALAAVFVASPWILLQVWGFVSPGLYRRERLYGALFVLAGSIFFIGGGAFGYFIAFPFAAEFLLGLGQEQFQAAITIERYLRFLLTVILGLGVMFELPVIIFLLSGLGLVTPGFLMRHFRWAVLIIFIVAALITPTPDVVNLCLFAVPTILLYLLGVGAAALVQWRKKRRVQKPK